MDNMAFMHTLPLLGMCEGSDKTATTVITDETLG